MQRFAAPARQAFDSNNSAAAEFGSTTRPNRHDPVPVCRGHTTGV
jgi:hypothetical protein